MVLFVAIGEHFLSYMPLWLDFGRRSHIYGSLYKPAHYRCGRVYESENRSSPKLRWGRSPRMPSKPGRDGCSVRYTSSLCGDDCVEET